MLTPEQYEQARRKLTRYDVSFDMSLESKLPQPTVRTKAGKVAKRQPQYDKRPKSYYQAQCSFRGLPTSGLIEELQHTLQSRDLGNDLAIHHELVKLGREKDAYEAEQESICFEELWQAPTTSFEDKLLLRPQRALQEEHSKPDSTLRWSCCAFEGHKFDLLRAAAKLGLACEELQGPTDLPPGSVIELCQVIGEATAVQTHAESFRRKVEQNAHEQWSHHRIQMEAEKAADHAHRLTLMDEATQMDDWDLTGEWKVQCDLLDEYEWESPPKLSMEIFKDNYRLDAAGDDDTNSEDGDSETGDEDHEHEPVQECEADRMRPRLCARFDFGVLEGIMRIYPPSSTHCPRWKSINESPTFDYQWRGRDTGEGEIMCEIFEYVRSMTFSDFGTKFEGVFDCPTMGGSFPFSGTKVAHGRGQELSSSSEWADLSKDAWERESLF